MWGVGQAGTSTEGSSTACCNQTPITHYSPGNAHKCTCSPRVYFIFCPSPVDKELWKHGTVTGASYSSRQEGKTQLLPRQGNTQCPEEPDRTLPGQSQYSPSIYQLTKPRWEALPNQQTPNLELFAPLQFAPCACKSWSSLCGTTMPWFPAGLVLPAAPGIEDTPLQSSEPLFHVTLTVSTRL